MTPIRIAALVSLLATSGCSGKSGDPERQHPPTRSGSSSAPATPRIETIPEVDVSALGASERRRFVALVNDLLSPCGEPVSVARCITEHRACRRCVPAGRYVARLAKDGYEDSDIRKSFDARYGANEEVAIDLAGAPVRGSPMAPITIVEFSDYQCPHCRLAHPVLNDLVREFDGRVKLVHKFYPLPGHPLAANAALAATCAQQQGKFWEYHDLLFENQDALELTNLLDYARRVGLDMDRFQSDLTSNQSLRAHVQADADEGRRVEVHGTPTVFIDGRRYGDLLEPAALRAYIEEELSQ